MGANGESTRLRNYQEQVDGFFILYLEVNGVKLKGKSIYLSTCAMHVWAGVHACTHTHAHTRTPLLNLLCHIVSTTVLLLRCQKRKMIL